MIIGFCGPIGSGKTSAAKHLAEWRGFAYIRFAAPLKAMLAALGLNEHEIDGDLKEVPCELLGGKTPRWAMQSLGTEWGRQLIHPDLWVNAWRYAAQQHPDVVVDDVRFPNEVVTIHMLGGRIYRLTRPGISAQAHVSEQHDLDADGVLVNRGSLGELACAVEALSIFR